MTSQSKDISLELVNADSSSMHHHWQRRDEVLDNQMKEDLDFELQRLLKENRQLQMRILGVNELARLLQDSNEVSEVLREKNKRLEVAVIRLENRCSNFERKLKQSDPNAVGPKSGQSPFIPGPSRQILEALMKENSELKKTLSNMSKKGASGYLEVVKATQLEEVIDQQKLDIDFLREQIDSLTSSGLITSELKSNSSDTGMGLSLPTTMSDSGPLKRQLIKMQQAMKVKDRFCTLLSQQVAQLQEKIVKHQRESSADEKSVESESSRGVHGQESALPEDSAKPSSLTQNNNAESSQLDKERAGLEARYDKIIKEQQDSLKTEREEKVELVKRMQEMEGQMKGLKTTHDALTKRCEDLQTYNNMLMTEKADLKQEVDQFTVTHTGPTTDGPPSARSEQLEEQIQKLEKSLNEQIASNGEELDKKQKEITELNMMLEDAQYKQVIAQSKNSTLENELSQKTQEIEDFQEKARDLDEELRGLNSVNGQLEGVNREQSYKVMQLQDVIKRYEYQILVGLAARGSVVPQPTVHASYTPNLIVPPNTQGMIMAKDGTGQQKYTGLQGSDRFTPLINPSPMEGLQARGTPSEPLQQQQKPSTLPINLEHYPMYGKGSSTGMMGGTSSNLGQQTPVTPLASYQTTRADISTQRSNSPPTSQIYTTSAMGGSSFRMGTGTQHRAYTTSHLPSQTPTSSWSRYPNVSPTHGYHGGSSSSGGGGTPYMQSSVDPRLMYQQFGSGSSGYNPSVSTGTPMYVPAGQKVMSPQGKMDSGYGSGPLGGGSGSFGSGGQLGGGNFSSQRPSHLGPQVSSYSPSARRYYTSAEGRSPSPNDPYYHHPSSHQ